MMKVVTAFVTAFSLLGVSTVASAAPAASKLSLVAPARAGAKVGKSNNALGGGEIIALLGAIGVIAGAVIAASSKTETPTSA